MEDRDDIRRLKEDVADLEAEMQEKDRLVEEKDEAMVKHSRPALKPLADSS